MLTKVEEQLEILYKEQINTFFTFELEFLSEDEAKLKIIVYNTLTKRRLLYFEKEYDFDSVDAFISFLQAEVPLNLKLNLKIIGKIINRENRLVYFDLGKFADVKKGNIYRIFRPGKELVNDAGDVFGQINDTVGIVEVNNVKDFYSQAEILIGRIQIENGDWVERIENAKRSEYMGKIIQVYEDQVAISLGKTVGVKEGSYYGIFKEIRNIDAKESFRENIGNIRVYEVMDNSARGILTISSFRDISKILLSKEMKVEEVEPPSPNTLTVGGGGLNATGKDGKTLSYLAYQVHLSTQQGIAFRYLGGMSSDSKALAGFGVKTSIANSPSYFIGIDLISLDGFGVNVFINSVIPLALFDGLKLETNIGAIGGSATTGYNGLYVLLGVQAPFF